MYVEMAMVRTLQFTICMSIRVLAIVSPQKKASSEPCPERNALAHPIDKPFYNTWPSSKPSYNTWPSTARQSSLATITPSEAELSSCVTCMTSRPYLVSTASSLYKLTVVVRD